MLSIMNSGDFNPTSLIQMYNAIVLWALYGCELWCQMSPTNISELERAHSFCYKVIQRLPSSSNNMVSRAAIIIKPILLEIEFKKLVFIGQLC